VKLKRRVWNHEMSDRETSELAYYERNMLALREGYSRVLSLDGGKMTFHIPDWFSVGNLKQIEPNWDGHTTEEKWARIDKMMGITNA